MTKIQINGEDNLCSHIVIINIVEVSILPKVFYRFSIFPKIYIEPQNSLNSQSSLVQNNKAEGIIWLDFKIYYNPILIQTGWYWHENRHIDQCRIENPQIRSVFTVMTRNKHWGRNGLFNSGWWENWIFTAKECSLLDASGSHL